MQTLKCFVKYAEKAFFESQYGFCYDKDTSKNYYPYLCTKKKLIWRHKSNMKLLAEPKRYKDFSKIDSIIKEITENRASNPYCFYIHYVDNSRPHIICFESYDLLYGFINQRGYSLRENIHITENNETTQNEDIEKNSSVEVVYETPYYSIGYFDGLRKRSNTGRHNAQEVFVPIVPEKLYRQTDGKLVMKHIHIEAFTPFHLHRYLNLIIANIETLEIFPYFLFLIYSQLRDNTLKAQNFLEKLLKQKWNGISDEKIFKFFSAEELDFGNDEIRFLYFLLREIRHVQCDIEESSQEEKCSEYMEKLSCQDQNNETLHSAFSAIKVVKCLDAFVADNYERDEMLEKFYESMPGVCNGKTSNGTIIYGKSLWCF